MRWPAWRRCRSLRGVRWWAASRGCTRVPIGGASVEFAEYRRYIPGDDLRRLDWRAFGRTDRYYVKEFEADTNLRSCLVLDTSGSMGFGSAGVSKLEYARRLAGSLAYLAIQQGDAVGLTCIAKEIVRTIPPRRTAVPFARHQRCVGTCRSSLAKRN